MRRSAPLTSFAASLMATGLIATAAFAEEGMWTFDNFPAAAVGDAYGFTPDAEWLGRLQRASVRLDGGCSASAISPEGLVLTNHHCVVDCVHNLSSAENDLVANGFLAANRQNEQACPGAEASILQSISDVTARVQGSIAGVKTADVTKRRNAEIGAIEEECGGADAGKRCEVVSLYGGGQYKLYVYKRFQDVRLAFAPELQAAFFGGDPDNFNFPRYAYDAALVRLYENGAPAALADWLQFEPKGAKEGDLVFVSGHPGSTQRLETVAQLELARDEYLPFRLSYLSELRGWYLSAGRLDAETKRRAADTVFGIENGFKALSGRRTALANKAFFASVEAREEALRGALAADADLAAAQGDPWADIERAVAVQRGLWPAVELLERRAGAGSQLLWYARQLTRAAAEKDKQAADRLPEYAPANLPSLEQAILADRPVYADIEEIALTFWLLKTREYLGTDHPAVKALFGSRSAEDIARDVARNSALADPAARKRLWEGGASAVRASNDPALSLFASIDVAARAARLTYERDVDGVVVPAAEKIAAVRFAIEGDKVYPDATFTLRLSYGAVKGWTDPVHGVVSPFTVAKGLWARATGADPFHLAPKWSAAKKMIDPKTPFNFVTTNDIIGGNSGSPMVNAAGRIVGLVFDGNIHSLGGAYGFDPTLNRTVAVATPIILEALRDVYGANALADEIEMRR